MVWSDVTWSLDGVSCAMAYSDLVQIARARLGLVTRAHALEFLTRRQFEQLLATARLEYVHPNVYRIAGSPETWEQTALAAVLSSGDGAVVSFRAAAYLW